MNNLQIFTDVEFGQIRTTEESGNVLFCGSDIARALGYAIPSKAVNTHCKGVSKMEVPTNGGMQQMLFIPEGDLYRLIINSKLPSAEKFENWIFDEVLPSIRKHGAYLTDEKIEEVLTDPDTIIRLATQLKEERNKRIQAEKFSKQISISENSLLVREVAKIACKENIVIGEKRLWDKLRWWGLIFKNSTEPMQEYIDRGYFEVVEGAKDTYKGTFTYRTTRVTGKGQVYIIKRLLKESR